jgi:hypothetical protein
MDVLLKAMVVVVVVVMVVVGCGTSQCRCARGRGANEHPMEAGYGSLFPLLPGGTIPP